MKTLFLAAVATAAIAVPAQAAIFDNKADFLAAIDPAPTVIDFEGLVGTPAYPEYTTGGYFSDSGYTLDGVYFFAENARYGTLNTYMFEAGSSFSLAGSANGMFESNFTGNFSLLTSANAFGFDLGQTGSPGMGSVTFNFLSGAPIVESVTVGTDASFIGYAGSREVTSVVVSPVSGFFLFDNVTVGAVGNATPAVPEPSTWAMMLLGFFGVGGAMRSRRRTTVSASCS